MGRAAASNGNGRAVFPPGALTPMHRYLQPDPPRRTVMQQIGRGLLWVLAAVVVVAVGAAGGGYLYVHRTVEAVQPHSKAVKITVPKLTIPLPGKPAIALVVGYDRRLGTDAALTDDPRSDTLMLIRADPDKGTISLLSFPRDLQVPIYCPRHLPRVDRINAAYSECGPVGSLLTVEKLTGLKVNYLITVNFHGFKLLVNKLGGVWMDVDHRYYNPPHTGYATIDLHPGYQKLDGQQALDFVRFRHTDSDLFRLARQQLFVKALKDRIESGFSIFRLPQIVGALTKSIEAARGGGSGKIPAQTIYSYARFAYELKPKHLFQTKIDNVTGDFELTAPQSSIDAAVQDFEAPNVEAPNEAAAAALGQRVKPKRLKPSSISVLVLNGSTVEGLARDTSFRLAQRGYRTLVRPNQQPSNAPTQNYRHTVVFYEPTQPQAHRAATQLAQVLGGATVGPMTPEIRPYETETDAETVAVLGAGFDGKLVAEPVDQTPQHVRPLVYSNPSVGLELLRPIRHRVPFRTQVPHVIESRSSPASAEPVRVYKPAAHHKGIRLTFSTGVAGEYWGIEETDWNTAPVLDHPTETRVLGGRHYDFYYSGSHLHMVVLRTPQASYWVVNTLTDTLSNETMIAIAKGLRPLGS
jgi:LCP family protein required for cell wall assembly